MRAFVKGPAEGLAGETEVPGDKSISHRAAIVAALSDGECAIRNFSRGADCGSTLSCLEALGVEVERSHASVTVAGRGADGFVPPAGVLDAGNSATTMRLLAGALSPGTLDVTLTGDESLLKRPMGRVVEPLTRMGATVETGDAEGHPPLRVIGRRLRGIEFSPPVASAQVKSAVLLAGLGADGRTTVNESLGTRDHTERMLRRAGVEVRVEGLSVSVEPGVPSPFVVEVPGDFSSAAFLVAGALVCPGSSLKVRGTGLNQSRIGLLEILHRMGADIRVALSGVDAWEPRGDLVVRHGPLAGVEVEPQDVAAAIDELPLVALLASTAEGVTVIRGAGELRHKESDRIRGTVEGLRALGADIEETDDGMVIRGPAELAGARVNPLRDHRLAMTFAVAGLAARGRTTIEEWEWAGISFPGFLDVLRTAGAEAGEE